MIIVSTGTGVLQNLVQKDNGPHENRVHFICRSHDCLWWPLLRWPRRIFLRIPVPSRGWGGRAAADSKLGATKRSSLNQSLLNRSKDWKEDWWFFW